ncbi:hypothetical protein M2459_000020 [Parabacteroides sp. PF5-5]|nr:hypothetical protein [Parabacteroides sp. PH5-39]MDH6314305.1 hypothetical protein [Parabacteroides sp. PF5-13]MDH6318631.1 hypothetical protein [Parabacteroides sp. PH5-13]MDH6322077.1 hypothetical protein [Parabacteroides sp. PH5-8]MDH6325844.1 hypothetical protein [Parabacteroides sp. PH5-41]MDH6333294.1 hypothetical protein [Parabacteroides sp. PF5-5]MDH6344709.1 hypothetical protein [Parabacteroides sp. PH5-46]MDH6359315.1 hypothetical protein [Parabacteroides sp. PH5-16]MDH6374980.
MNIITVYFSTYNNIKPLEILKVIIQNKTLLFIELQIIAFHFQNKVNLIESY